MVPVIDQSSVDAYNQSVKAINDWQQKANAYNGCLIKEANADNTLIANSANGEQVLKDQQVVTLDQALKNVSGVVAGQGGDRQFFYAASVT